MFFRISEIQIPKVVRALKLGESDFGKPILVEDPTRSAESKFLRVCAKSLQGSGIQVYSEGLKIMVEEDPCNTFHASGTGRIEVNYSFCGPKPICVLPDLILKSNDLLSVLEVTNLPRVSDVDEEPEQRLSKDFQVAVMRASLGKLARRFHMKQENCLVEVIYGDELNKGPKIIMERIGFGT